MMVVGFSSGVLKNKYDDYFEIINLIKDSGADAIELSFRKTEQLFSFNPSKEVCALIRQYSYVSIHAPYDPEENIVYKDDKFTERIMLQLKKICNILPIKGIVFHPTNIKNFDIVSNSGLPILIENMDIRKNGFKTDLDISKLKKRYNFGFVLDIEHAFEIDPSFEMAKKLVEAMGTNLKEIHLSGAKEKELTNSVQNNHCSLADSRYSKDLINFVKNLGDIPIILEAVGDGASVSEVLNRELNYVLKS